jgi:hypothetical protein
VLVYTALYLLAVVGVIWGLGRDARRDSAWALIPLSESRRGVPLPHPT